MTFRTFPIAWAMSMLVGLNLAGCANPPAPSSAPSIPTVAYSCNDGSLLLVQFGDETAAVTLPDGNTINLPQQRAASGIWYANPQYTLRGKGDEATWTIGRRMPLDCRVQR